MKNLIMSLISSTVFLLSADAFAGCDPCICGLGGDASEAQITQLEQFCDKSKSAGFTGGMPAPITVSILSYQAVLQAVQSATAFDSIAQVSRGPKGFVVTFNSGCEHLYSVSVSGGSPVGGGEIYKAHFESQSNCQP